MKTLALQCFPRPLAAIALLVAGSTTQLFAQSLNLYFGRIEGDLTLDPGSSTPVAAFFVPAEGIVPGVGLLSEDMSVNISGRSPVMGDIYPITCSSGSLLTYPFLNTSPLQPLPTGSVTPHISDYHAGNFLLQPGTGNTAIPGVIDDQAIPYWVDLRLDLANGTKHYYAESFRSDALLPYDAPNGFPVDTRHLTEAVGALHVQVHCGNPVDGSIPLLKVDSAYITATLQPFNPPLPVCLPPYSPRRGEADTVQASVDFQGPGVLDSTFLVRAGRSYVVAVEFAVGDAAGPVTGKYSSSPTVVVSQGQIVDVDIVVDPVFCDLGEGCHSAIGRLEMIGANVFEPCLPLPEERILFGPFGNMRYAVVDPLMSEPGYPTANYKLIDVLPSVAVFPQAWPYKQYTPNAQFYFQTAGGFFEYMDLSAAERPYGCVGYGVLEDFFVMTPGLVKGEIRLEGPPACAESRSWIELIKTDAVTPCTARYFGDNISVSIVEAGGRGIAESAITGMATSPTLWKGKYELWLTGTKPEPYSSWNPGSLVLRMPTENGYNFLWIKDRLASGSGVPNALLDVYPGGSYVNDHDYCLSEITLTLVNPGGLEIAQPNVRGNGLYAGQDPLDISQLANYELFQSSFWGTPTTYTAGNATIHLCLPQGEYALTPSVAYHDPINGTTGRSPFPPFLMKVGCKQCINVEVTTNGVGPILKLAELTDCTSLAEYALQGTVCAAANHLITNVSYVINGGTPVVLCAGAACGAIYDLGGVSIPLIPCANTLTISAKDDQGLSSSTTLIVNHDSTPPVLFECTDRAIILDSGLNGAVVNHNVTAADNCDPNPQVTCVPPPGFFPTGQTSVTCTAVDHCGNASTCTFTVTVQDVTSPTITCPGDLVVCADPGQTSGGNLTYLVTASDDLPGVNFSCNPPSGGTFAVGTTPVNCLAIDVAGNSSQCVFMVTVNGDVAAAPLSNLTRCRGDSATYTAVTSGGGALSYGWSLDGSPIGTDSPLLVVATSGMTDGNHTVQVIVTGECGSVTNRAALTVQSCARGGPCSLTQGFYGNANGKFNGTRSITLLGNLLSGAPLVVGKAGVRSLTIAQSDVPLLQTRMPASGTPTTLPNSGDQNLLTAVLPLYKATKFANVFLGQTITLSLNVRLDPTLLAVQLRSTLCTQGVSAGPDGSIGTADDVPVTSDVQTFMIPNSVLAALADSGLGINDVTVRGLLELANRALAGLSTASASIPDINSAVDAINRGFDGCRVLVDCTTHMPLAASPANSVANPIMLSGGGGTSGAGFAPAAKAMAANNSLASQILRTQGFNCEASKEPGEPDIAGNAGGKPIWWEWAATLSGSVTIQTAGSSFDTLLGVYVGSSRSNLTLIASGDDTPGSLTAGFTFSALAGTNYLIVVDGFDGDCGNIVLQIITGSPRLGPVKIVPGGGLRIGIEGELGRSYIVESSSDLTVWNAVAVVENSNGILQFVDRQARTSSQRFYRVVFEP